MRPAHRGGWAWLLLLLAWSGAAGAAEPVYPALTGRVVDQAGLLTASERTALEEQLAGYERANGTQVVVVTLASLQGLPIEQFGVDLGRHWGIGQQGKDNGVLLIVAPKERKLRIEVGYGLEGTLTDAISSDIVRNVITPYFKRGDFAGGIDAGVGAILKALGGNYTPQRQASRSRNAGGDVLQFIFMGIIFGEILSGFLRRRLVSGVVTAGGAGLLTALFAGSLIAGLIAAVVVGFLHAFFGLFGGRGGPRGGGGGWWMGGGGFGGGGSLGGGSFGGGFSGGGGSFGGGGASGGW